MTPAEALKNEREEVTKRIGYYIPPYRVSELMKVAHKIMETMTKSTYCMTFRECRFVLSVVGGAIETANGEKQTEEVSG